MMRNLTILSFLVMLGISPLYGQQDSVWVIGGYQHLAKTYNYVRGELILDGRYTNALGDDVRLFGLRTGLEIKRIHRMGFGLYGLSDPIVKREFSAVNQELEDARFSFSYISTYYERVLFFNKWWEWSVTGHTGIGSIRAEYRIKGTDQYVQHKPISVNPIELSTSLYFNPTWWVSVGAGGGYRFMSRTPQEVRATYNSPIFLFKVKLRFVKIVRQFFNEDVKYEY